MRLKAITLKHFRCYRDATIDLSADVVAIYGRNGVGKTAVFDAIELALLGSIGRFENEPERSTDFLSHVSGDSPFRVTVSFHGGQIGTLAIAAPSGSSPFPSVECDGHPTHHRDLLYDHLLTEDYVPARREVSAVRDLFRATSMLSQHTMRHFIEAKTSERKQILSNLAGVGFYQRCADKALAVNAEAVRRLADRTAESRELNARLQELEAQHADRASRLVSLRTRIAGLIPTQRAILDSLRAVLTTASASDTSLSSSPGEFVAATRATCQEHRRVVLDVSKELEMLALSSADITGWRNREMTTRAQLTEVQAKKEHLERTINELGNHLGVTESEMRRLDEQLVSTSSQEKLLRQALDLRDRQALLDKRLAAVEALKNPILAQMELLQLKRTQLSEETGALESRVNTERQSATQLRATLRRVESLATAFQEHAQALLRTAESDAQLANLLESEKVVQQRLERASDEYASALRQRDDLQTALERGVSRTKELGQILGQLKVYVTSCECPLCGHSHESQKDLFKAIQARIESLPAEQQKVAQESDLAAAAVDRTAQTVAAIRNELLLVARSTSQVRADRIAAEEVIARVAQDARDCDVAIAVEALETRLTEVQRELAIIAQQLAHDEHALSEKLVQVNRLESTHAVLSSQHNYHSTELMSVQEEIRLLAIEAAQLGAPRDCSERDVEELRLRLEKFAERKSLVTEQASVSRDRRESLIAERDSLDARIGEMRLQLAEVDMQLNDFAQRCSVAGLERDVHVSRIEEKKAAVQAQLAQLDRIMQDVSRYETGVHVDALDEERSALVAQLVEIKAHANTSKTEAEGLQRASAQATHWSRTLSEAVYRAVEMRVAAHRPEITRLFKSMIPCPYLFEDITITPELNLGIQYRGTRDASGEPRLFLSEAQANVLALSLFLSFSVRQQWSHLDTILLDDPVQHLDDLDAVALLDNLRAIALGHAGRRRQMILSTCNKNLYLLLMRKLSHIGLRFTGISLLERGLDGPEIHYDIGGPLTELQAGIAV